MDQGRFIGHTQQRPHAVIYNSSCASGEEGNDDLNIPFPENADATVVGLVTEVAMDFANETEGDHLEGGRPLGEAVSIGEQVTGGQNLRAVAEHEECVPPCCWVMFHGESTLHNRRSIWDEPPAITPTVDR